MRPFIIPGNRGYKWLDNLKLGYGGTKTEMQRLLKDAQAIQKAQGKNVKYSIDSYADIVEAIHVVQSEMGITGTTAKEASETISGSFSAMKAAASNALTALVLGGGDLDRCINDLVESAKTFGKNVMPAVVKALKGAGKLIEELAPIIEAEIPGLIETLLPPLIKAATALIRGIIVALPDIIKVLAQQIPNVLKEVWAAFREAFGDVPALDKVENFFGKIKDLFSRNAATIKKLVPVIAGLVGAFMLFKKLKFLGGLFGGGKGGGGGIFSGFQALAKLKVSAVLKGMANLAIILGGLAGLAAVLMWVAPYIAQLSDIKSIGKLLLVMTAIGLLGSGMAKMAGMVGVIPVATVTKGLADIAIIMIGLGALAFVLGWASNMFNFDIGKMVKLLAIISMVGVVGSALASLAGLVGAIPVAVVVTGLENIALALGGISAIIAAFAALSMIDGFDDFMTRGGETLANICRIIGEMAGSLIGGIGEGITNSLPAIGENISAFAASIEPAMTSFSSMNFEGLQNFATAFGQFALVMAGDALLSWFTGGIDYGKIGTDLTALTTNGAGFFAAVQAIPEAAFTNATKLFQCLNGIGLLPNSGGVVQWFTGTVDYNGIATGLAALSGTTGFFTMVQSIPEAAFTAATNLFSCLSGIGSLPKSDGLAQWFTGTVNYQGIADGLAILAGEGMIAALTAITSIPAEAYSSLSALFEALAGIKQMPKEGGIFGWFTGDNTTSLTNVASQLPQVATSISDFFTNLGGITDFSPIKNLFETLSNIDIDSDAASKGFLGLGSSAMETMGSGLSAFATNAASFFSAINDFDVSKMKSFFDELGTVGGLPDTLSGLDGTIGTTLSNIATNVDTQMTSIKTKIETALNSMVAAINLKQTSFYSAGAWIMEGLNAGMESKRSTLMATANSIANSIRTTINSAMRVASPSKVTFETGYFVGQGLALGMQSTEKEIRTAAQGMSYAAMPLSGYTPESSTIYNNGGNSEYTTISPVFNLTVSGTTDDRATARRVKRWVGEAINEAFASMERKL